MSTFAVNDVKVGSTRFKPLNNDAYRNGFWSKTPAGGHKNLSDGAALRYTSALPDNAIDIDGDWSAKKMFRMNMFATTCLNSFSLHLPLRLSPDAIWFTITQGLARHVNENSEKLREHFVTHEGKQSIEVLMPPSFTDKDWPDTLPLFEEEISKRTVGEVAELVVTEFSTSTELTKMCSRISLMDSMQSYFEYYCGICCGIPTITLAGTPDDWKKLRAHAEKLGQYELDWWMKALLPVLDKFVEAANGKADKKFFQSMINLQSMSGPTMLSGWFQVFFPYLRKPDGYMRNMYMDGYQKGSHGLTGIDQTNIPCGVSSVPFIFKPGNNIEFEMEYRAGISSISQDPDSGTLEPHFGWSVVQLREKKS